MNAAGLGNFSVKFIVAYLNRDLKYWLQEEN